MTTTFIKLVVKGMQLFAFCKSTFAPSNLLWQSSCMTFMPQSVEEFIQLGEIAGFKMLVSSCHCLLVDFETYYVIGSNVTVFIICSFTFSPTSMSPAEKGMTKINDHVG